MQQSTDVFELRVIDESDIDAPLDQRIRDFLVRCFSNDAEAFSKSRGWHGSMPAYTVLLEHAISGAIVGHASVVDRTILAGEASFRIAGVQNVAVDPDYRGRQLVDRPLDSAMTSARARGFDMGMLFCVPRLCHVYSRAGWLPLAGRNFVKRDALQQKVPFESKDAAMVYPLKRSSLPPGTIDLAGNDW